MSAPTFTITCEQMAYLTAAVIERDLLRVQLRDTEAKMGTQMTNDIIVIGATIVSAIGSIVLVWLASRG